MDNLSDVSLQEQVAEVRRELKMRERVYARLIDEGKMTTLFAETRTQRLTAVLRTLEALEQTARRAEELPLFDPPAV